MEESWTRRLWERKVQTRGAPKSRLCKGHRRSAEVLDSAFLRPSLASAVVALVVAASWGDLRRP